MEVSTKKVLISVISTVIEFALIAVTVVYFILIKQPHPGDIYFFLGIVLAILVLRQVADIILGRIIKEHNLYFIDIPSLLNQYHYEAGKELNMDVRVAFYIYDRHKDRLLIPGRCEIELDLVERTVELKGGEGVVGYIFLYRDDIRGLFHDLVIPGSLDFCQALRKENRIKANKEIRWIYAHRVNDAEKLCGIIYIDSVKDSWIEDESQQKYGIMLRLTERFERSIANLYQKG